MQKILKFIPGLVLLIQISACKNDRTEDSGTTQSEVPEIIGVSVWDRISTRSQPLKDSPRTTLLSLGESFYYLDTFAIDSSNSNTKFLMARLSDSSMVWVYDFASVLNAKPAVIRDDVPLYMRPDLLTITDKELNTMEIVAVVEEWDSWIKVVNEKKGKKGWIKKEYLSYNRIDLAFALLVKRSLEEENPEQKIKNLEDLIENNPYPNTIFIEELKMRVDRENEILRESKNSRDRENQERKNRRR